MSFPKLSTCRHVAGSGAVMDLVAAWPEWLVWFAAGAIGAFALATIARVLAVALDADAG